MRKIFRQLTKNNKKETADYKAGRPGIAFDAAQDLSSISTKYRMASCQSMGKLRSHNEDTILLLNTILSALNSPVVFGLFLVADGMGGHLSGELASILAAQGISQYLLTHIFQGMLFEQKKYTNYEITEHLRKAVDRAQSLLLQRVPGGGTTLTFVMALGEDLFSVHVGDSRIYQLKSDGVLILKTRDHSLVRRLVELGEITVSEANTHPYKNILYRALGQTDPFEPDIEVFSIETGERLLICSDGLWDVVEQETIHRIMKDNNNLDTAAAGLVDAANEAGGPDNISVVLVERLT